MSEQPVGENSRGQNRQVRRQVASFAAKNQVFCELNDPPAGITIEKVSQADDAVTFVVRCDADDVNPGLKGNLIVTAFTRTAASPER